MDNLSAQPPSTMAENCPDVKSDASKVLSVVRQRTFIKCECTIEVLHSAHILPPGNVHSIFFFKKTRFSLRNALSSKFPTSSWLHNSFI